MKKIKKIAALGLAVMMMASAITGCSSSNETETATTENDSKSENCLGDKKYINV